MNQNKEIDEMIKMLDGFAAGESGRLKVFMDENMAEGTIKRQYHHGRCDIGSPYDTGDCFDLPESECDIE